MADETSKTNSPKASPASKEDAETRAARRELKQHSISEPATTAATDANERPETPATEGEDAAPAEDHVLSPKKKRAHDQLDSGKVAQDKDGQSGASTDSAKDRASRSEPEKKRPRDGESKESTTEDDKKTGGTDEKPDAKKSQTSSNAFAASGFGKLAAGGSGFASLGGGSASPFGAPAAKPMASFASPTKPSEAPKLSFGGGSSASPFAGLSSGSNGFGSALGGGSAFGASAGSKLGSFAAPGTKPAFGNDKPAKAFGAPESDAEDDEDDENDDDESKDDQGDEERAASPEKEDDKKKARLQKVEVNDGEQGEVTVVSVRAKVFHLDKEVGWKERGSGMLKINVPVECVELDQDNSPIPGSFDASGFELEDEEAGAKPNKVARLILRQDQTHRVILNTAIAPAMEFQEKATLKSVGIVFTAFEGDGAGAKPVNITAKMTAANAKIFMNEVKLIQRELRGI